jgi:RNA polymerase sigma-70 factor, ECF subfamily
VRRSRLWAGEATASQSLSKPTWDTIPPADSEALAALYDQFGAVAFGLVLAVVEDRTLAEGVVATGFLSWWHDTCPPSPLEPRTVRGRLLVLVHRRAVAVARDGRRSHAHANAAAMTDQASHLLAPLPPTDREAVALAYFGGLTLSEVAQATGTTRETVGRRVSSGLACLGRPSV